LMMFHFLYDSLDSFPLKKIQNQLDDINEDGPMLLKAILKSTFTATNATTFAIKEKLFSLDLKRYKNNVQALNQDVREMLVDLIAAGHQADKAEVVINLFRAYNTSPDDDFNIATAFWRNQWDNDEFNEPEILMEKAEAKYTSLRDFGTWGKKSAKDEQIVALTSQVQSLKEGTTSKDRKGSSYNKKSANSDEQEHQWKKDRSLASGNELTRNDKTYKWCKGPGHGGIGMWVLHDPGSCKNFGQNKAKFNNNQKSGDDNTAQGSTKKALAGMIKSNNQDLSQDEIDSKLEAILAVLHS
jgi:hypothetical protein